MNEIVVETNKQAPPLNTMDANTLLTTKLPRVRYIVDELIPQGLHVLAGAPKIGKSYLTLWLCLQIATGKPVWELESHKCGVLYISLEDTPERIKKRILEMTDSAPDNLRLATCSNTITEGLAEQLEAYLKERPDTGFIAIDTLQKVRSSEATQASSYAVDYMALSQLKSIADKHRIAILLVHHLRKQKSNDPFEMISGTTGITGAVDASYVMMQRRDMKRVATLYAQGRDITYQEIDVSFRNSVWQLAERRTADDCNSDEEIPADIVLTLQLLHESGGFSGSVSELLFLLGIKKITANQFSRYLKAYVDIFAEFGYTMRFTRSGYKRVLTFVPIPDFEVSEQSIQKLSNGMAWETLPHDDDDGDDDENGGAHRHDDAAPENIVTIVTPDTEDEKERMESLLLNEPPMEEEHFNDNIEEETAI